MQVFAGFVYKYCTCFVIETVYSYWDFRILYIQKRFWYKSMTLARGIIRQYASHIASRRRIKEKIPTSFAIRCCWMSYRNITLAMFVKRICWHHGFRKVSYFRRVPSLKRVLLPILRTVKNSYCQMTCVHVNSTLVLQWSALLLMKHN